MDLKRKIARLVMTSCSDRPGRDRGEERRRLLHEIADLGVGGCCIFGGSVEGMQGLVSEIAGVSPLPLLVASDLERGLGQELEGGTIFPSHMAVGATGDPDLAWAQGVATAREARAVGINLIFAPVADVLSEPSNPIIGVRSYGDDPAAVAALVSAFVEGCQVGGAAATVKHFPGHGATTSDSHIDLPVVSADCSVMRDRELVPFRAAVEAGVRAVMVGHVAYPALTGDEVPATLSPRIVEGILRHELGFEGVVVTDALMMGAITKRLRAGEAAVAAIEAGADVLLMPEDVKAAIDGVASAVLSGRMGEERIDSSLARIDSLLSWLDGRREPTALPERAGAEIGRLLGAGSPRGRAEQSRARADHERLADLIATKAVTLLKDDGLLPVDVASLSRERAAVVALSDAERPPDLGPLRERLDARLPGAPLATLDERSPDSEIERVCADASRKELCVVFIFDAPAAWRGRPGPSDSLLSTARRLIDLCPSTIVAGLAGPLVASLVPEARAFLCCYDASPAMQRAAIDALFGGVDAAGRLPVACPANPALGNHPPQG